MFNLYKEGEYPLTLKIGEYLTEETLADWATIMQGTELKAWERMLRFWTAKEGPVTQILTIGKPNGEQGIREKRYWLGNNDDPNRAEIRVNPSLLHAKPLRGMTTVRAKTGNDLTHDAIINLSRHVLGYKLNAWTQWLVAWTEELGPITRIEDMGFTSDPDEVLSKRYWFDNDEGPNSPYAELFPDYLGLCMFDEYLPVPLCY